MDKEEFVAVTFYIEERHVRDVWNFLQSNEIPALEPADDERFIEAEVPVSLLARASRQAGVIKVKPIVSPQPTQLGVRGQGAAAHGARASHSAGYRGQGVKVGIIDTGFQGFSRLQGAELPSSVVARCYWGNSVSSSLSACAGRGGHGTRVTEVLYETAPGATYYIAESGSKGKFRMAAQWMISQGVDVINISFSYVWDCPGGGTSPYTDSPLKSVDIAESGGAVVTVAAGNYGEQTWFGGFDDPDDSRTRGVAQPKTCTYTFIERPQLACPSSPEAKTRSLGAVSHCTAGHTFRMVSTPRRGTFQFA